ncbi:ralA-binding protein 1 isoform X2 [Tribolium castaneum]|uniref:ralA-binding protein 1 isoform X2 n=1 Tax=Tribolium castaneum TaxID=7070 RepID=UPI00046C17C5|nr:PREDICTED: ralA-binding protein 1 isoform X2 [Tribolium castaneum]|eukprot:XP_008193404.1 PREDICTED: ralA-binding protein 1 isoform X2 [Tribolium castaneum]
MDFDSPDVMKDFPGLYASELNKQCNNDSDYSDENEKVLKKDILIGKRKEKKDKDKGYAALEGESSADENFKSSPSKTKKAKPFKFSTKAKEKRDKSREKEKDLDKKKDRDKKNDKKQDKEKVKSEKTKKLKQSIDETADIGDILPIFGASLDVAVERSRCHDGVDIPLPIRECIDYVETVGMSFEGIYKISGTKSKVLQIRKMYNQRGNINLNDYDPPTVTSLVKTYLRDLPEPLFTNDLLIRFEEAGAILNLNTREKHLKILVDLLPPHNKTLLGWLITHLHNVSLNEKCNKMNKQAISTALNHTFHCSSRLLHALLHHCLALFPTITIARYVPPLESGAKLPEEPPEIETELKKQESLLTQIHKEMNVCCISKQREELLWEVQRIITQLKRKLKTANRDKEAVEKVEAPEPEAQPEEAASEEESELDGSVALLKFKNEGLLLLRDSLLKDIQAERGQIAVLRSQITGEVPPVAMVPNEDLDEVMDLFLKENQILQIKKINLVRQIIEEQEMCIELRAQILAKS